MPLSKTIRVTKAVAAAGNYSAEDVISGSASVGAAWEFPGMPGSGLITKAQLICETTGQVQGCTLFLFKATPTCELRDNVASTCMLHADLASYLGKINFDAMTDLGGDSEAIATPGTAGNLPLEFESDELGKLYGVLVTRDAFTNEAAGDDYTITLTVEP
jgi:hypothetical protein